MLKYTSNLNNLRLPIRVNLVQMSAGATIQGENVRGEIIIYLEFVPIFAISSIKFNLELQYVYFFLKQFKWAKIRKNTNFFEDISDQIYTYNMIIFQSSTTAQCTLKR